VEGAGFCDKKVLKAETKIMGKGKLAITDFPLPIDKKGI